MPAILYRPSVPAGTRSPAIVLVHGAAAARWLRADPATDPSRVLCVNDPRCPISQARRFRERLLELGRVEGDEFYYHELGEQGHYSLDGGERLATFELVEGFLGRFV